MACKVVLVLALMAVLCAAGIIRPSCPCAKIYQPVCGSNKVTYNNMCEFQCGAKYSKELLNKELFILRSGRCDGRN